ncbi:hypothetical protein KKG36_01160 [Patescibacteria group bacterium]|nr:hypothetical protein [Patescibacteria group bacterium]
MKRPEIINALDVISQKFFGRPRKISIEDAKCVVCGREALSFKDELSAKEFDISGLCQTCQDNTFD